MPPAPSRPAPDAWISAAEAARTLGVTRQTLYAYVSRGFIRSETTSGATRERRYARDDVDRMRRRGEERRNPDKVAAHALQWGLPILESSITLIADGRLYYRGHDAVELARTRSLDEVASLIWTGQFDAAPAAKTRSTTGPTAAWPGARAADVPFVARAQAALAIASASDAAAFDLRPDSVALTGGRILTVLARVAADARGSHARMADALAAAWKLNAAGAAVIRAALILCADHELNVSAFTARCVASANANPYAVVIAGLSALEGTKHGGMTSRVESMLRTMRRETRLRAALATRLRHGERIGGFGHPLYPAGDPRASALLEMLGAHYPKSAELRFATTLAAVGQSVTREQPNLDFALAAVARVLALPAGSGITLFALGRTIGWIGHAIEQYATEQMIRPRARYVGRPPNAP